jgi:hypothetical protein
LTQRIPTNNISLTDIDAKKFYSYRYERNIGYNLH